MVEKREGRRVVGLAGLSPGTDAYRFQQRLRRHRSRPSANKRQPKNKPVIGSTWVGRVMPPARSKRLMPI